MFGSRALLALGLVFATLPAVPASANMLAEDALPRVEDALCPGVMGISTDAALQILDRVRHNAALLGIRLANPNASSPNLLIAFVDDGQSTVKKLMNSRPQLFDTLTMPERRDLENSTSPARVWNVVVTRTRDGLVVPLRENLVQITKATMWSAHSKIYTATRQDIIGTVVLFDGKKISGLTTTQLADYASMRGFASDFSAHPNMQGTILTLFNKDGQRPGEMTKADLAFLHDLYSGIANLPARAKNRSIEHSLAEQGDE